MKYAILILTAAILAACGSGSSSPLEAPATTQALLADFKPEPVVSPGALADPDTAPEAEPEPIDLATSPQPIETAPTTEALPTDDQSAAEPVPAIANPYSPMSCTTSTAGGQLSGTTTWPSQRSAWVVGETVYLEAQAASYFFAKSTSGEYFHAGRLMHYWSQVTADSNGLMTLEYARWVDGEGVDVAQYTIKYDSQGAVHYLKHSAPKQSLATECQR